MHACAIYYALAWLLTVHCKLRSIALEAIRRSYRSYAVQKTYKYIYRPITEPLPPLSLSLSTIYINIFYSNKGMNAVAAGDLGVRRCV